MKRLTGTIKWFDTQKCYGFIERPNTADIFVHGNDVQGGRPESLQQGLEVEFEIGPGPKGPQARRVRLLAENDSTSQSQVNSPTNVSNLTTNGQVKSESGLTSESRSTENVEQLIAAIGNFFFQIYGTVIEKKDKGFLANILDSSGLSFQCVDFAFAVNDEAVPMPDDIFDANKVFHLWEILQPIMVAHKGDRLLQLFCKGILNPFLNEISDDNASTLTGLYLARSTANFEYTRYLNSSFLGVAEFDSARALNDIDPQLADAYYRQSLKHLLQARRLGIKEDRYNYGMVGVANYYLARSLSGEPRSNQLLTAIENLELAEDLGDLSTEHFVFLGNALLEHAEETNLTTEFQRAINKLQQAFTQEPTSSNIVVSLARANLLLGISTIRSSRESGTGQLKEAVRLFDLFESLDSPKNYSEEAMKGRRGQAYLQLWYVEKDINSLNKAIHDLDQTAGTYRHNLANALFELYNTFRDPAHSEDLKRAREINDQIHLLDSKNKSHLKQRGRIYSSWAELFSDLSSLDIAIDSFLNCLPNDDPEITEYLGAVYADRGRRVGSEEDFRTAIQWLEKTNEWVERRTKKFGLLPKVYRELAQLVERKNPQEAISYYDKAIQLVRLRFDKDASVSTEDLDQYNGILGTNYFNRYVLSGNPEDIYLAREYYQGCYDLGSRNPTLLALFGNACLKIAKIADDEEEHRGFTEDAIKYLELSREQGNENSANFSKLGEAYLRLYKHYGERENLSKALMMFLESLAKGNDSPENYGLIGDCYYAQSRFENSIENLYKALEFKQKSREKRLEVGEQQGNNASWKEHHSLLGRIHLVLFERDGRSIEHFVAGLNSICEAARDRADWPWPICQLAEVVDKYPEMIDQAVESMELTPYPNTALWHKFLQKDSYSLWAEGASLSARRPDTKTKILGGKSRAYVEDDPHGLLSATFVFKPPIGNKNIPLRRRIAWLQEERERTVQLAHYLNDIGDNRFLVPTPLDIIRLENTAVYCMRRALGNTLSDVIQRDSSSYAKKAVRTTLHFLAAYHAWHPAPQDKVSATLKDGRNFVTDRLTSLTRAIGLPFTLADDITNALQPAFEVIGQLPIVEKKDSHTENWIVTNNGRIVMIDIELPEPEYQFLLADMIQMVEDLPLLPLNAQGWKERCELVEDYLNNLQRHLSAKSISLSVDSAVLKTAYLSLALWRALINVGLAFAKEHRRNISMSSASRWNMKERYYFELINWIPSIWTEEGLRHYAPDWKKLTALIQQLKGPCLDVRKCLNGRPT